VSEGFARGHYVLRSLVKNMSGANQNIGRKRVAVSDESIGASQFGGHVPWMPPKSTPISRFDMSCA